MGVNILPISVVCTVASFVGLQCWAQVSLEKLKLEGSLGESYIHSGNVSRAVDLLLTSGITIALLANLAFNVFILIVLCLKSIFFVKLSSTETRKVAERLVNYLVYKAAFLPLILPPTLFQAATWSTWVTLLCTLKMFQALARDRLERLNASPSATPWTYFRVYSVLLLVLSVDIVWMRVCMLIYKSLGSTVFLLLFFEPLSIAFETLQAIMVHGFQLLDIWSRHSMENNTSCERSPLLEKLAAGALSEWKGTLVRNFGFFLDVMTLLTALCHHFNIWWFHGMAFHLVDAVIFLNTRALGGAIIKRIRGFIKLSKALRTLHGALPDATPEELEAYDDECAICREPMAKAKKLSCNHLFHLACLRSWLDQGLSEVYSCPTCRRPLFAGGPATNTAPSHTANNEQLARQISSGLDRSAMPGPAGGAFADPTQTNPWRGTGLDPSWPNHPWAGQVPDGAGPSTDAMRSAGLSRVQMMMRHLAAVSETYAQTALEDAAWSLFPMAHPQTLPGGGSATTTTAPPSTPQAAATTSLRFAGRSGGGLRFRNNAATATATASPNVNDSISHILAMADTVREVLPNIPDEIIFQDLQRTNSVNVTVNNLIQM